MYCVPACKPCREAGVCKRGEPPKPRAARDVSPNRNLIWLKCGCQEIPWPVLHILGENILKALCDYHGWQEIVDKRKPVVTKYPNTPMF